MLALAVITNTARDEAAARRPSRLPEHFARGCRRLMSRLSMARSTRHRHASTLRENEAPLLAVNITRRQCSIA